MAWSFVGSFSGQLKSTSNLAVSATASVGDVLVVCVCSNDVSGSDAIGTTDISDTQSNTYTRVASNQGQTNAGDVAQAIYVCEVATALAAEDITFTNTTAAKAMVILRFTGGSDAVSGTTQTANADGTGTYSLTHSGVQSGDLVVGFCGTEDSNGNSFTDDTDTSNGSWEASIKNGTTGGGAASNMSARVQYKIATATASQTWDGSLNSSTHREILLALSAGAPAGSAPAQTASVATAAQNASGSIRNSTEVAAATVTTASDATISARPSEAVVATASQTVDAIRVASAIQSATVTSVSGNTTSEVDVSGGSATVVATSEDPTIQTGGQEDPTAEPEVALVSVSTGSQAKVIAWAEYP
jgi:hypothetical protein